MLVPWDCALRLNEDLIEALALLHDIGHPPFGHAGEDALRDCLRQEGGFSHNQFALTLVEELEQRDAPFPGLNLSREVLAGQTDRIDKSRSGVPPLLEVQLVDLADSVTYDAHDVDDALKLGLLEIDELLEVPLARRAAERFLKQDLPAEVVRVGMVHELIDLQVTSVLAICGPELAAAGWHDAQAPREAHYRLALEPVMAAEKLELEAFLSQRVYRHEQLLRVRGEAQTQLAAMFDYFSAAPERLPDSFRRRVQTVGLKRCTADYLAGMTDRFCRQTWRKLCMTGRQARDKEPPEKAGWSP